MGFIYSQLFVTPTYPETSFGGKTVIVTGSNVGLGKEAARHFVRLDATKVILAVRNIKAGEDAKRDIQESTKRPDICEVWELDLASYESVKAFASRASKLPRIDVLLENAGIATNKYSFAEEDERTITVNVVSTFLLAFLLLPKLKETAKQFNTTPHLSIVSSEVHRWTNLPERDSENIFKTLSDEKTANMAERYQASKLLEVFIVRAIAPSLAGTGVVLNMLTPGLCHSELSRDGPWYLYFLKLALARSTEVGSRTLVHATSAAMESHGCYLSDCRVAEDQVSPFVKSEDGVKTQEKLWKELRAKLETIQPGITRAVAA